MQTISRVQGVVTKATARQELLELPNGGKLTLKCGSIQLEFERMIKVKPIN